MIFRRTLLVGIAIAAPLQFTSAGAQSVTGPTVYRCKEPNGTVLYQDYACKGGTAVEIKPDAADPAAIKRLREAQAEFDRAAAQRRANEERAAAIAREQGYQRRIAFEAQSYTEPGVYSFEPGYVPYGYYVPYVTRPIRRPDLHRRVDYRHNIVRERRVPADVRRPRPE